MARPPLHANSWITQGEADDLDAKLAIFIAKDDAVRSAETSLNALVVAASIGAPEGQMADVFNDGRFKPVDECTIPAGYGLPALKSTRQPDGRKTTRRAAPHDRGAIKVPGRRHTQSAATQGQMVALENALDQRSIAYKARADAALLVNYTVGPLELKAAAHLQMGQVINAWGDGRKIAANSPDRVVPKRLSIRRVQFTVRT